MRNCVRSSASLRVTQLDIMLSTCRSSSWHRFPLSPYESSAGRGVLLRGHPRPWPVAKPRTLRVPAHKVHVPASSGTSFQTKKMFLRSRAPSRSSSLSSTLVRVAPAPSVSSQKSCFVPAPFSHSTTTAFSSAHFLRLRSKVSRFAACVYTAAPVDCPASPTSPLPQHTPLPSVAACP